jgi:hypothetical protein
MDAEEYVFEKDCDSIRVDDVPTTSLRISAKRSPTGASSSTSSTEKIAKSKISY